MKIKSELGRFLFQNMFAHDPCHDFSPLGGGKRMHKLNSRFDQVNKIFQPPTLGGGDGNAQFGGKIEDLNPTANIDLADDYRDINGSEVVGTYSGFEKDGAINTVTNGLIADFRARLISGYEKDEDKLRITTMLSTMAATINAVTPKDDDTKLVRFASDIAVNDVAGLTFTRATTGVVTRSAENLRRVYINQMQDVIEMNDYIRLTIVMHNATTDATTGATTGDEPPLNFEPIFGGRVENLPTNIVPPLPPAIYSTNNTGKDAFLPHLSQKVPTIELVNPPTSEPVKVSKAAAPGPESLPPTGNTYTNMHLILDHLHKAYEEAKTSLAANDEVAELSESLDDMKSVVKFYRFAFKYYTTHIENISSMYSINNSDFIKDALLYYFIDLYANRYNSDAVEPSKLMSDDASYRNSVFEIIYMLRKPIKKEMGGGANSKNMTGGTKAHYDVAVYTINSIPLVDCQLIDDKYTILWSNSDPATQIFDVTEDATSVNTTLDAINENTKKHLLAVVPEGWLPVVTDGIKDKLDAVFDKNDPKSLWNKQHKGQLHRFLIRGVNQRNGDKAIKAQLDRLITDVKSQMLNVLRQHIEVILASVSVVVDTAPGSLSVEAKGVANGFLMQLCSTIQEKCIQEVPATNVLYDTQDKILNKIIGTGPYANLDSDLLNGFVKQHNLESNTTGNALTNSCLVNTPNFITNQVIAKTLTTGLPANPNRNWIDVNIINNALMAKYPPDTKYVDHLIKTYNGTQTSNKGITFKNMCPVTCVLDAMGSFGSCSNGSSSDQYVALKQPTQMYIETDSDDDNKFEFNMTTRHKNNVVIVEYYLIYNGFTVSNCVIEATIKGSAVNILSANNTFADMLNYIEQNAPTDPIDGNITWETFFGNHSENIVRIISRKMIGDFGQELSAVYKIGGYQGNPDQWQFKVVSGGPQAKRYILKANGDRPSFVREAQMLLAEPDDTNENTVIMYLGETNGIFVMSKTVREYFNQDKKGGSVQMKRKSQTKKRKTRNHRQTRKISAKKTRRLKRISL
jgi:hypothetical protein